MPCEFKEDSVKTFPGLTLFSKGGACLKPTAVYLPPKSLNAKKKLDTTKPSDAAKPLDPDHPPNVVLWLHGFYVRNERVLFHNDNTRGREQVLGSGRDVVLIAPFLGYTYWNKEKEQFEGNYSVRDLGDAKWGERYLDEVLAALSPTNKPINVKNLVIACHSGGGEGMRSLVGTLGKYQSRLKECWGFDCLYGAKAVPDDARFWYQWVSAVGRRPLYIFYGPSTIPQSVKLYLMGRGRATPEGNRAAPPRAPVNDLHVTIAHYEMYMAHGQAVSVGGYLDSVVDDLMTRPPPKAKSPAKPAKPAKPKDGDFVKRAADNLAENFIFVEADSAETGRTHYFIARAFFLSRLRNATFW